MRPVQACGWTGECSEPGCSDKCVPSFVPFATGASLSVPAKALKTMECPIMAYFVAAANGINAESSSRKLKVSLLSFTTLDRVVARHCWCVYTRLEDVEIQ